MRQFLIGFAARLAADCGTELFVSSRHLVSQQHCIIKAVDVFFGIETDKYRYLRRFQAVRWYIKPA